MTEQREYIITEEQLREYESQPTTMPLSLGCAIRSRPAKNESAVLDEIYEIFVGYQDQQSKQLCAWDIITLIDELRSKTKDRGDQ